MKVGKKVAVCHDGKISRGVEGVVVKQHNGHHITVKFTIAGQTITQKFRRDTVTRWRSGMTYCGWADSHLFCPWFRVVPRKRFKSVTKGV